MILESVVSNPESVLMVNLDDKTYALMSDGSVHEVPEFDGADISSFQLGMWKKIHGVITSHGFSYTHGSYYNINESTRIYPDQEHDKSLSLVLSVYWLGSAMSPKEIEIPFPGDNTELRALSRTIENVIKCREVNDELNRYFLTSYFTNTNKVGVFSFSVSQSSIHIDVLNGKIKIDGVDVECDPRKVIEVMITKYRSQRFPQYFGKTKVLVITKSGPEVYRRRATLFGNDFYLEKMEESLDMIFKFIEQNKSSFDKIPMHSKDFIIFSAKNENVDTVSIYEIGRGVFSVIIGEKHFDLVDDADKIFMTLFGKKTR